MIAIRRWYRRARTIGGALSRRSRVAIALLLAMVIVGAILLSFQGPKVKFAPILSEPLAEEQLAQAVAAIGAQGIPVKAADGNILVPEEMVSKARGVLAYEGLMPRNMVDAFRQITKDDNLWSTSDQNSRRWQAATMDYLSKSISMFPPVRSATVIYDPGSPRRIGSSGIEPTASVKVVLKHGASMDRKLVTAIADEVAGSIAGMSRRSVRIIDSGGQSHSVGEDGSPNAGDRVEHIRVAEEFYRQKIADSLRYIESPIIALHVSGDGPLGRCESASVSIPRSHFAGLYKLTKGSEPDDPELEAYAAPQLERIAQSLAKALGTPDASAINVNWYYDSPPVAGVVQAAALPPGPLREHLVSILLVSLAVIAMGAAAWSLWRRRQKSLTGEVERGESDSALAAASVPSMFEMLSSVSCEEVAAVLQQEHPQAAALVLAHMPPARSATVLAAMGRQQQVELTRRIAALDHIDAQVLHDVARSVWEKLKGDGPQPRRAAGVAIVARILHHATSDTEQAVMDALSGDEPALADSIRRRMFSFEDIADLPAQRLRAALESFDLDELAVALRTAGEDFKDKIAACLSPLTAQRLRDEMEQMGPVRLSDVESAQQHLTQAVRRGSMGQYVAAAPSESGLLA